MPYYYANKVVYLKECPKTSPDKSMKKQASQFHYNASHAKYS